MIPPTSLAYDVAVVNKGESFLYKDGAWVDWSDYIVALSGLALLVAGSRLRASRRRD